MVLAPLSSFIIWKFMQLYFCTMTYSHLWKGSYVVKKGNNAPYVHSPLLFLVFFLFTSVWTSFHSSLNVKGCARIIWHEEKEARILVGIVKLKKNVLLLQVPLILPLLFFICVIIGLKRALNWEESLGAKRRHVSSLECLLAMELMMLVFSIFFFSCGKLLLLTYSCRNADWIPDFGFT